MRYLLVLFALLLVLGCSQPPVVPDRSAYGPSPADIGSYSGEERYYHEACILPDVEQAWDAALDYVGGKEYGAIGWGWLDNDEFADGMEPGDLKVRYGGFGKKWIDGYPYDYQYCLTLNFVLDEPRVIFGWVEPLGSMARRVKIYTAGVMTDTTWLGANDVYTLGRLKPVLYFEPESDALLPCMKILHGYDSSGVDVDAADLHDIELVYAKVWAVTYLEQEDAIHVRVLAQLLCDGEPFVQSLEAVLGLQ